MAAWRRQDFRTRHPLWGSMAPWVGLGAIFLVIALILYCLVEIGLAMAVNG